MEILSSSLVGILESHGVLNVQVNNMDTIVEAEEIVPELAQQRTAYYWEGRYHLVPSDFEFPSVTLRIFMQYWLIGDRRLHYPPFKTLSPVDLPAKVRKRLTDAKFAMKKIEALLTAKHEWIINPTVTQIDEMYSSIEAELGVSSNTSLNRQRRIGQLSWRTAVKLMRSAQ